MAGRPKKKKADLQVGRITVTFVAADKAAVDSAAKAANLVPAVYVRQVVLAAIKGKALMTA